jgi:hypothetical protein
MRLATLGVIVRLLYDEAFGLLTARLTQKHVQAAVIGAAGRFPPRAIRMLAAAAGPRSAGAGAGRRTVPARPGAPAGRSG